MLPKLSGEQGKIMFREVAILLLTVEDKYISKAQRNKKSS